MSCLCLMWPRATLRGGRPHATAFPRSAVFLVVGLEQPGARGKEKSNKPKKQPGVRNRVGTPGLRRGAGQLWRVAAPDEYKSLNPCLARGHVILINLFNVNT